MAGGASEGLERPADLDLVRLEAWLAHNLTHFSGLIAVSKFAGGQSNPTYRLDTPNGPCVLRRKPFGVLLPSAHAIEREYALIAALHPTGFPVPRPFGFCEDASVIGALFYVMELIEGRIFWNGRLPELETPQRRPVYASLVETLAQLHLLNPERIGLGDYGAPGNYFERQVRRWTKQYRSTQTDVVPQVEKLIEWLPTTLPEQHGVSIIHGDYRIDNVIFAADSAEIRAILDWELSTLGDPLADFAYIAMNWVRPATEQGGPALGGLDLNALAIPDLDDVTALYCDLTQRTTLPDLNWYFAYNLFRLVSIAQGIRKRLMDGNASSAHAEQAASKVVPLALDAWEFAQRAGAR